MNQLVNWLICPDCHNRIFPYGEAWLCAGCGRVFREKGGILCLLPAGEDSNDEVKTRERQIYDNAKELYGQFKHLRGARKVIADWSLTKIEDINYEIVKPYLNGGNVLEVGCGRGYLTARVSQSAVVAAFDISKGSLEYAKELGNLKEGVFYFQGNVYSIPFESGTFDVVIVSEVLEHLLDLDRVMVEIRRVLRTGGLVMASVPNSMMYLYPLALLSNLVKWKGFGHLAQQLKREVGDGSEHYHHPFLPWQFKKLFQSRGFRVLEHRTSMLYLWRFPYNAIIEYGDRHYRVINKVVVGLIIKVSDFLMDNGFPLVRWFGIRQHLLAKKEDV